jgi:hypothetical protein
MTEGANYSRTPLSGSDAHTVTRLRELAPRRRPSHGELLLLAELQANRLLEFSGVPQAPIPLTLISDLPRIEVRVDPDLPASGCTQWLGGRWLIVLNAAESSNRMRFSLAHEFKHIVDHRDVTRLYASSQQAEVVADYFAACLLMPKRAVKRAWGEGPQQAEELARLFEVSPAAMTRRLRDLGLADGPRPPGASGRSPLYWRAKSPSGVPS